MTYIITLLQYSQVNYYSQVEVCAAEYSTILEQVGKMTLLILTEIYDIVI